MNLTPQWINSDWFKALGWTFVHSLWQIAVIGLLLYVILRMIPGRSAHMRYTISTMAFWMIVMTVLSTFIIMLPDSKPVTEITGQIVLVKSVEILSIKDRLAIWLESRIPMMLSIWFGGVLILMMRLLFSLGWIRHMRSVSIPLDEIQMKLNELIHRLKLKINPTASESRYVSSPVTIGHIKPFILFPVGIINQLNPNEVEAILTHELAHIVRRDYLSNLLQTFIETLFYYHPVTWWISSMVRAERENRADDLAISWCGDHLGYAKALLTVQEMEVRKTPSLAIGFASKKGAMLNRIQRILHIPYKNHNQMEKTVLLSLCSLCFLAFTLTSHKTPEQKKENCTVTCEVNPWLVIPMNDSIPDKGTYRIHKKTDDQDISIEVQDGDIKELQIDGKEISPSQFDEYGEIIDELFGSIESPPSMEDFDFGMPAMPPMPEMPMKICIPEIPSFAYAMPPMPPMPPMTGMNELEMEHLFGEAPGLNLSNNENIDLYLRGQMGDMHVITDSVDPNGTRIIIIRGGDTTEVHSPHVEWYGEFPNMNIEQYLKNNDIDLHDLHLKYYNDDWKQYKDEWKHYGDQWKQNSQEYAEQWKENMLQYGEQMREQQERMRDEELEQYRNGDYEREIEDALREQERAYGAWSPRMNMTDEMVSDGLIGSEEEVEVILTPDKLKIDGKKMPDDVHQKYLGMYEEQQGVELSGSSRIEFKTKSRRSM